MALYIRLTQSLNKYRDLAGHKQGHLTITRFVRQSQGHYVWWADCGLCGGGRYLSAQEDIRRDGPQSCGCKRLQSLPEATAKSAQNRKGKPQTIKH